MILKIYIYIYIIRVNFVNLASIFRNAVQGSTKVRVLKSKVDMTKWVKPVWPDPFDLQPVWPITRLTNLKMTRIDLWPVLTRNPINPTQTRLNPPILPCLPMLSRLRLRCNFYKIFTYFSLLNMLCAPL